MAQEFQSYGQISHKLKISIALNFISETQPLRPQYQKSKHSRPQIV